ncbi:MAG TPA: hypothetical protein VH540_06270 [Ktedonobacterales bacterium]
MRVEVPEPAYRRKDENTNQHRERDTEYPFYDTSLLLLIPDPLGKELIGEEKKSSNAYHNGKDVDGVAQFFINGKENQHQCASLCLRFERRHPSFPV